MRNHVVAVHYYMYLHKILSLSSKFLVYYAIAWSKFYMFLPVNLMYISDVLQVVSFKYV